MTLIGALLMRHNLRADPQDLAEAISLATVADALLNQHMLHSLVNGHLEKFPANRGAGGGAVAAA